MSSATDSMMCSICQNQLSLTDKSTECVKCAKEEGSCSDFSQSKGELVKLKGSQKRKSKNTCKLIKFKIKRKKKQSKEPEINKLNEDCLRYIFGFLTKRELIRNEMVCKRWQAVSKRCWVKQKFLHFNNEFESTSIGRISGGKFGTLKIKHFKHIMRRCGEYLTSLDVSSFAWTVNTEKLFKVVGKTCKNLQHLSTDGFHDSEQSFGSELLGLAANLKSLNINGRGYLTDSQLMPLILGAKNLEKLVLGFREVSTDWKLPTLNDKIKHLELGVDPEPFIDIIKTLCCLEVFKISSFSKFKLNSLQLSSETLQEMEFLNTEVVASGSCRISFPNLKILHVFSYDDLNDDLLSWVAAFCPNLENIVISSYLGADNITNDGVKKLVNLRKLKSVGLCWLSNIESSSLEYLASNMSLQLQAVICPGCELIDNSGPSRLISLCPNLITLDVFGCRETNSALIQSAIDSLTLRTTNVPLTLYTHRRVEEEMEYYDDNKTLLKVVNRLCDGGDPRAVEDSHGVWNIESEDDDDDDVDDDEDEVLLW